MPSSEKNSALSTFYVFISFFSGFIVMVVEIAGAKLIAPIFGNTLYTWSILIAVVLSALSFGSTLGGWVADRARAIENLHTALAVAILMTFLLPPLALITSLLVRGMEPVAGSFIFSSVLFIIPGIVFGMISPIALRLLSKLSNDAQIGFSGGVINASGAIGSVIGTVVTGLFLMDHIGISEIYYLASGLTLIILMCSVLLHKKYPSKWAMCSFAAFGVFSVFAVNVIALEPNPNELHHELSYYQDLKVIEKPDSETGDTIRYMILDGTTHGALNMSTLEPPNFWQRAWRVLEMQSPQLDITSAMFVGGGSYGAPQLISKQWPEANISVIEIDSNVSDAAREWFFLDDYPSIEAITEDARRYMNSTDDTYDFIYLDAFKGRSIPSHLATKEFFELVQSKLNPGGVVMANIIGRLEGDNTALFDALYKTIGSAFDDIQIYTSPEDTSDHTLKNIFLLFGGNLTAVEDMIPSDQETQDLLDHYVDVESIPERPATLFTDNFQPVDRFVSEMMRKSRQ